MYYRYMGSVIESESTVVLGDVARAGVLIDIGSGFVHQVFVEKADCKEKGCTVIFQNGSQGELIGEGKKMEPFLKKAYGQEVTIVQARFGTDIFFLSLDLPETVPAAAD